MKKVVQDRLDSEGVVGSFRAILRFGALKAFDGTVYLTKQSLLLYGVPVNGLGALVNLLFTGVKVDRPVSTISSVKESSYLGNKKVFEITFQDGVSIKLCALWDTSYQQMNKTFLDAGFVIQTKG